MGKKDTAVSAIIAYLKSVLGNQLIIDSILHASKCGLMKKWRLQRGGTYTSREGRLLDSFSFCKWQNEETIRI